MPTERLTLIGAGGHAKVVLSAINGAIAPPDIAGIADDNPQLDGQLFCGRSVVTPVARALQDGGLFHVAVGDNAARERLFGTAIACAARPFSVIHPGSHLSPEADIGEAVFLAAGGIVAPYAKISAGVIINHGAVVDHDCVVGPFTHIGPNATLGGACVVGARVLIGAGANILPQVKLGDDVVVGAGAVVLADVPDGVTVTGVPARTR